MKRLLTTLMAAAVVVACSKKVEETYVAPEKNHQEKVVRRL